MIFREKLTQLRKSQNMTQEQLAEKLGVSRQAVSRWESGDSTPDMNNLLGLCDLFSVSSDYLIHDDYQSDDDIPAAKEKTECMLEVKSKKKQHHLIAAIAFTVAMVFSAISTSLSTSDLQFAISIFNCAALSGCASAQYYLYFKKN